MKYDAWFDTHENKTLLAICARKLIANIGAGAVAWGVINIVLGVMAIRITRLNAGILILGVLMFVTGIQAMRRPSLGILLAETTVTGLLLLWNIGIAVLNFMLFGFFNPLGIILPLIVLGVFANQYRKLQHIRGLIESVDPGEIRATKRICKALLKKKLKNEPGVVETANRRCRAQLMHGRAFFIQRDLMRAFVVSKDDLHNAVVKPDARKLALTFLHPLGSLRYRFDKRNSEKLKVWFSSQLDPGGEPLAEPDVNAS